ncbi:MAG TPA: hypothetical protein VKB80_19065 [Kofleriaceae bacterium]|nr:hypothetical protein [Kofleriaceae bacterium]
MESTRRKKVLCPMEKNGKTFWLRIGSAFINGDGSTNVYLDAYPTNGKLQIRDLDERDTKPKASGDEARPNGSSGYSEQDAEQLPF